MTLTGRCLCGAIRFESGAEPITVRQCWCRDCQYTAAGSPTVNAFLPSDAVRITGDVRWFDKAADSGPLLARGFCGTCGTPLFTQSHARRHLIGIRVGTFDEPGPHGPQSMIWTVSAPEWAVLDPALPQVERQPPPVG